ncbi:MAG: hypothetical protein WBL44_00115 [Nitrososphaeraceae archaeon]
MHQIVFSDSNPFEARPHYRLYPFVKEMPQLANGGFTLIQTVVVNTLTIMIITVTELVIIIIIITSHTFFFPS